MLRRRRALPPDQVGLGGVRLQRVRPVLRVVAAHQRARHAVLDGHRQAADRRGDHRRAAGLRLQRDQAEGLAVRGHHQGRRGAVPVGEALLADRRVEAHHVADAELGGQLVQALGLGQAGARGAADDRDDQALAQLGLPVEQHGDGPQQHVRGLQRLYPAGEKEHRGILRQAQRSTRGTAVARPEHLQVHPGVDDGELVGARRVVQGELGGLLGGVGDQPVGRLDHLGLTDHPGRRLGEVTLGQCRVLDLRHGVHRVHQRDAPALGCQPADLAGEPVVRVDEVVVARPVTCLGAQHPVGEGAELGREVLLEQALVRPGGDVPDEHTGGELDGRRVVRADRPGEHLDLDVELGEALGQLDDVDVHPARVTGAGLVQRRGVHAQHRYPAGPAGPAADEVLEPAAGGRARDTANRPYGVLDHLAEASSCAPRFTAAAVLVVPVLPAAPPSGAASLPPR